MAGASTTVSVVIPTHNRADILPETLDAVLDQDYGDYEVICVDDRSGDGTPDVLSGYTGRVRSLRVDFGSPAPTRNAGVAEARGEFLLFTDDDCIVPGNWISGMLENYERRGCDALSGGFDTARLQTRAERYQHYRMRLTFRDQPKPIAAAPMMNFMIRKSAFELAGGFNEAMDFVLEDWEFCYRLAAQGYSIYYDPSITVRHRNTRDWSVVTSRLEDTARDGLELCRQLGVSRHKMMARSTLRWLASPIWSLFKMPLDLYVTSVHLETVFWHARFRAYLAKS